MTTETTTQPSLESQAMFSCERSMQDLQARHPDWFELYDDTVPDNAPRADVVELLASAPNDFAKGLMYGKFTMRVELEAVTGRAFA